MLENKKKISQSAVVHVHVPVCGEQYFSGRLEDGNIQASLYSVKSSHGAF